MNLFKICNLDQKYFRILFSKDQKDFIDSMPALEGREWNGNLDYPPWQWGDFQKIQDLKNYIRQSLLESQGLFCAFCGNELDVTSEDEIEHIAPKGADRYPQFMFHSSNLILACSLCNGFEKKEKKENFKTIGRLNSRYEDCYFNIVHPYLDNPADHLELGRNGRGITISSMTLKGQKTIAVFKLDEEPQTNARGHHLQKYLYDFDPIYSKKYEEACNRNGI